jgi:hypothetical protein
VVGIDGGRLVVRSTVRNRVSVGLIYVLHVAVSGNMQATMQANSV